MASVKNCFTARRDEKIYNVPRFLGIYFQKIPGVVNAQEKGKILKLNVGCGPDRTLPIITALAPSFKIYENHKFFVLRLIRLNFKS